ncbi:MAG: ion transporter [Nannocystaceae bacterium]
MSFVSIRIRTNELLSVEHRGDATSRWFNALLGGLIVLNVVATILESVSWIRQGRESVFAAFETASVAVFSLEYVARLWSAANSWRARLRLALRPMMLVDLLSILPWYLPRTGVDLRVLRALRLLRVVRVLRLGPYAAAQRTLLGMVKRSRYELGVTLSFGVVLVLLAASSMYLVEREAQPDAFSSIPAAMWWAVVTLTTVGYGDVYPVTPVGQAIGAVIATLGIGLFALPTAILGASFLDALRNERETASRGNCPHCGGDLGDH